MKILFQGDSITDAGRSDHAGSLVSIGQGYACLVAARLGADEPGRHQFINRGISGNRVVDVYARIKRDGWNHTPDLLSMLIGVNDVWHEFAHGDGVEAKRFRHVYQMLVEDTLEALPGVRVLLMEPFVLPGSATEENWSAFRYETEKRAEAVREIASECGVLFLPLQNLFDEAAETSPASLWLGDGVHPTPAGHQLIADAWLRAFRGL